MQKEFVVILTKSEHDSVCCLLHDALVNLEKTEDGYFKNEVRRKIEEVLEILRIDE